MAKLPEAFKSSDVADDVWEPGEYLVEITKSEMKDTKAGTGQYLQLGFKCMKGKQKGQMIFTNLNLVNPNEIAVNIARKELKKLCSAVGKIDIEDSNELHAIPLVIKVTKRDDDDPYPGNDIKAYKATGEGSSIPKANPFKK